MSFQVEVIGADKLIAIFDRFIDNRRYGAALAASSEVFMGFARVYPSQSGKPFKFVSEKQRRYVMMAINKGIIQVPYRRRKSGGLSGAWSYQVKTFGESLESEIINAMPYASWVMHTQEQAQYHQGNWQTTDTVLDESIPQISRIWERTMAEMLGA